ncbi:hypothetical protein D3C79_602860 [compost metagenome]
MVGQVQPRFSHTGKVAQVPFDQPAAGGAADAFNQQGGFGQLARVTDERFLHIGTVIQG